MHRIITSLAGRRIRSASACQALREAKDVAQGGAPVPTRLAPATLAKLTAELLADQVRWYVCSPVSLLTWGRGVPGVVLVLSWGFVGEPSSLCCSVQYDTVQSLKLGMR